MIKKFLNIDEAFLSKSFFEFNHGVTIDEAKEVLRDIVNGMDFLETLFGNTVKLYTFSIGL